MKQLSNVLEADRDYTLILNHTPLDKVALDIMKVESMVNQEFKVLVLPEKLNDEEKEHLFNLLSKEDFRNWKKGVLDYYVQRFYKIVTDNMVRYSYEIGVKDIDKEEVENRAIQITKGIYNECKDMLDGYINKQFEEDIEKGKIIAKRKDNKILFVNLGEEGIIVLTPQVELIWDENSGYSVEEFLIEALTQNFGKLEMIRNGIKTIYISDENEFNKLMNNGIRAVVDLWGGWCQPCRMFEKELEPYLQKMGDITLIKLNTDFNSWANKVLHKYEDDPVGIPLVILKDGEYELPIRGYREGIVKYDVSRFFEDKEQF